MISTRTGLASPVHPFSFAGRRTPAIHLQLPVLVSARFGLAVADPGDKGIFAFYLQPENRKNQAVIDRINGKLQRMAPYEVKSEFLSTFLWQFGLVERLAQKYWDDQRDDVRAMLIFWPWCGEI